MSNVTLEACLALRNMGYSQHITPLTGKEYVACPEPLDALDWIESEHGWGWNRVTRRTTHQSPIWYAWRESTTLEESPDYAVGDSADSLIIAIGEHHRQHAAQGRA